MITHYKACIVIAVSIQVTSCKRFYEEVERPDVLRTSPYSPLVTPRDASTAGLFGTYSENHNT